VTNKLGGDFLVTAADFPHGDVFREDRQVQGLESRGDLSQCTIQKILADNPKRLYGLRGRVTNHRSIDSRFP